MDKERSYNTPLISIFEKLYELTVHLTSVFNVGPSVQMEMFYVSFFTF